MSPARQRRPSVRPSDGFGPVFLSRAAPPRAGQGGAGGEVPTIAMGVTAERRGTGREKKRKKGRKSLEGPWTLDHDAAHKGPHEFDDNANATSAALVQG